MVAEPRRVVVTGSRVRLPWYKRYPRDFREGTRKLTLEERGFYNDVLDLIYENGDEVVDDDASNAHKIECDIRTWRRLKARLVDARKLFVADGMLRNERASAETSAMNVRVAQARMAGELSAQSRRKSGEEPSGNSGLPSATVPTSVATENEQITESQNQKEEKKDGARAPVPDGYAFVRGTMRVKTAQFDMWVEAFPNLDVRAALQSRFDWYVSERGGGTVPKDWFLPTSNWLRSQNAAAASARCGRPLADARSPYERMLHERKPTDTRPLL